MAQVLQDLAVLGARDEERAVAVDHADEVVQAIADRVIL